MTTSFFIFVRSKIKWALHFPVNIFCISAIFYIILPFVPLFSGGAIQKDIAFLISGISFSMSLVNLCSTLGDNFPFSRLVATLLAISGTLFISTLIIFFLELIDEGTAIGSDTDLSSIENFFTHLSFSFFFIDMVVSMYLKQNGNSR